MKNKTNVSTLTVKFDENQAHKMNVLVAEEGKITGDFSKYTYLLKLVEEEYDRRFANVAQTA